MAIDTTEIRKLLEQFEARKSKAYYDSNGIITIGLGINIEQVPSHLDYVFEQLGIREEVSGVYRTKKLYKTLENGEQVEDTAAESALEGYYNQIKSLIEGDDIGSGQSDEYEVNSVYLDGLLDDIMLAIQNDTALKPYKSSFSTTFSLTDPQINTVFDKVLPEMTKIVNAFLSGNQDVGSLQIPDTSKQYLVLTSLAFNAVLNESSSLQTAIKEGDAIKAWYEIRYRSNGGDSASPGIAKRRYAESELFGLPPMGTEAEKEAFVEFLFGSYQSQSFGTSGASNVIEHIAWYENKYAQNTSKTEWMLQAANAVLDNSGQSAYEANSIWEILVDVKTELVAKLAADYKDNDAVKTALGKIDGMVMLGASGKAFNQGKDVNIKAWDKSTEIYRTDYSKKNDLLIGSDATKSYALSGSEGDDLLIGNAKADKLYGGSGEDTLVGRDGDDELHGWDDKDTLIGGNGTDRLYGEKGDDTLIGGIDKKTTDTVVDQLEGGDDDDTYYAGDNDIIKDSDGKGKVYFEGTRLTGGTLKEGTKNQYEGDGGTYTLSDDGTLKFEKGGKVLFILNYDKEQSSLRIKLTDGAGTGDTDTGSDGNGTGDDGTELFGNYTDNPNGIIAENGFEALANYDENGEKVNGEARETTLGCGVIDAKDNIYSQLSVWTDANQDGVTDDGELKTLSELNITSISVDAEQVDTYKCKSSLSPYPCISRQLLAAA